MVRVSVAGGMAVVERLGVHLLAQTENRPAIQKLLRVLGTPAVTVVDLHRRRHVQAFPQPFYGTGMQTHQLGEFFHRDKVTIRFQNHCQERQRPRATGNFSTTADSLKEPAKSCRLNNLLTPRPQR